MSKGASVLMTLLAIGLFGFMFLYLKQRVQTTQQQKLAQELAADLGDSQAQLAVARAAAVDPAELERLRLHVRSLERSIADREAELQRLHEDLQGERDRIQAERDRWTADGPARAARRQRDDEPVPEAPPATPVKARLDAVNAALLELLNAHLTLATEVDTQRLPREMADQLAAYIGHLQDLRAQASAAAPVDAEGKPDVRAMMVRQRDAFLQIRDLRARQESFRAILLYDFARDQGMDAAAAAAFTTQVVGIVSTTGDEAVGEAARQAAARTRE